MTEVLGDFHWACAHSRPNGLIALQRKARWPIPDDTGHVRKQKGGELRMKESRDFISTRSFVQS